MLIPPRLVIFIHFKWKRSTYVMQIQVKRNKCEIIPQNAETDTFIFCPKILLYDKKNLLQR